MGIMITYHGYNNGHNNPVCNAHKNMGVHYTQGALHTANYSSLLGEMADSKLEEI